MPTRKLLVKRGDVWEPKTEIIGPGYRAAHGLVALVPHCIAICGHRALRSDLTKLELLVVEFATGTKTDSQVALDSYCS
jgi:hypothetical protein